MRENKFRVYDKESGSFVSNFVITPDGDAIKFDEQGVAECIDGKIEQFTGLIDKNGVSIYDGDIVQGDAAISSGISGGDIIEYKAGVKSETWGHGCSGEDAVAGYRISGYFGRPVVLGNIHQHPELLK